MLGATVDQSPSFQSEVSTESRRTQAALCKEFQLSLGCEPTTRFRRLEHRRVLNASFALVGLDLQLFDFADGTNLDISINGGQHEFTLSSGTWFEGGVDSGSNTLTLLLAGQLSVDAAMVSNVSLLGVLSFADDVSITTGGGNRRRSRHRRHFSEFAFRFGCLHSA